jgi:hypothetical protein
MKIDRFFEINIKLTKCCILESLNLMSASILLVSFLCLSLEESVKTQVQNCLSIMYI